MRARSRMYLTILQQYRQLHQWSRCFPHYSCVVMGGPGRRGAFVCTLDSRHAVGTASIPIQEGTSKDYEVLWWQWRVCKVCNAWTRWCKRLFRWSEPVATDWIKHVLLSSTSSWQSHYYGVPADAWLSGIHSIGYFSTYQLAKFVYIQTTHILCTFFAQFWLIYTTVVRPTQLYSGFAPRIHPRFNTPFYCRASSTLAYSG